MVMKTVLTTLDDVDESLREHYVEGKDMKGAVQFVLAIDGPIDPIPQVKSLKSENASYRIKAKDFEEKYGKIKAFEGMDHAEVIAKMDRIVELEAAHGGKINEDQVNKIVEGRVNGKLAPLQRQLEAVTAENTTLKKQNENFLQNERTRKIGDEVRSAALATKMTPSAVEDAILLAERVMDVTDEGSVVTKDNVGILPGLDVRSWMGEMQSKRPHWWGASEGGGSQGNSGNGGGGLGPNPWKSESWNMTEQGRIFNTDPVKADKLAKAAGTKIGGMRPQATKK